MKSVGTYLLFVESELLHFLEVFMLHDPWFLIYGILKEKFDNLLLRQNGPGPFCYLSDYNRVVIQHENDIYNQNRTIWFDYNNNVW